MNRKKFVGSLLITGMIIFIAGCGPQYAGLGDGISGDGPERVEGGIRFSIHYPKAQRVIIAGDFNGWSSSADPLFDREGTGFWTIVLPLPPGRYEYKYVIDGKKWIPDPRNPERVKDGFGGYNSVVTVGP
jgi:1,4-alpha-glucan branching enzyme